MITAARRVVRMSACRKQLLRPSRLVAGIRLVIPLGDAAIALALDPPSSPTAITAHGQNPGWHGYIRRGVWEPC